MPKRAAGLSAAAVRTAKPGSYVDGGGLMLVVKPSGAATWMLRYMIAGRRRDMGLGGARGPYAVSLAGARAKVAEIRRLIAHGIDPLAHRAAETAAAQAAQRTAEEQAAKRAVTFQAAADRYIAAHEKAWRNDKHRMQWARVLRDYAGPHFGGLPVADVATRHVEAALRPIWHEKPETAGRLRARIESVLDFAVVQGWRSGDNPARWRGHLDKLFPPRGKVRAVRHHPALPWQDLPAFMARLRAREGTASRALEFAILTAARSGEVFGARWSEIDFEAAVWTVPAGRMKAGKEHRVPLTPAALALLRSLAALRQADDRNALVFPGQREGRPLSVMSLAMVLRRLGHGEVTPHGFRSTFRDWAGETTAHPREVVEAALAHKLGDRVEQAYARGDLFQKRRRLMVDWASYCAKAPADVVNLRAAVGKDAAATE